MPGKKKRKSRHKEKGKQAAEKRNRVTLTNDIKGGAKKKPKKKYELKTDCRRANTDDRGMTNKIYTVRKPETKQLLIVTIQWSYIII